MFALFDIEGKMTWDTAFSWWNDGELTSDRIASPKIVVRYFLGEGLGVTEIFNSKGVRLARVDEISVLDAFPDGVYFFSIPSGMEINFLNVYDSLGNLIWKDTTRRALSEALPLTDSLLLYAASGELFILDPQNGKTKLSLSGEMKVPPFSLDRLTAAQNGQFFALSGNPYLENPTVLSFTKEGALLWDAVFERERERMYDVAFSPNGRFLSVIRAYRGKPTAREVQFRDNLGKGELIWKTEFDEGRGPISSVWNSITIFDSIMTIVLPSGYNYFREHGLTLKTQTKCIFFEPQNGSIVDSFTVKGFLTETTSKVKGTQYFRATLDDSGKNILILRNK